MKPKILMSKDKKLNKVSKDRPSSLLVRIPSSIRDIMKLKEKDTVRLDLMVNDQQQIYIKMYKI